MIKTYEHSLDSDRNEIKKIAYSYGTSIWVSYSDEPKSYKQYIDKLRLEALNKATKQYYTYIKAKAESKD